MDPPIHLHFLKWMQIRSRASLFSRNRTHGAIRTQSIFVRPPAVVKNRIVTFSSFRVDDGIGEPKPDPSQHANLTPVPPARLALWRSMLAALRQMPQNRRSV